MIESIMSKPLFPAAGDDPQSALLSEARAWARKLAVGSPTTEDAEALKRWCAQSAEHAQAWRRASAAWQALGEVMQTYRARNPVPAARPQRQGRRRFLGVALGSAATAMEIGRAAGGERGGQ